MKSGPIIDQDGNPNNPVSLHVPISRCPFGVPLPCPWCSRRRHVSLESSVWGALSADILPVDWNLDNGKTIYPTPIPARFSLKADSWYERLYPATEVKYDFNDGSASASIITDAARTDTVAPAPTLVTRAAADLSRVEARILAFYEETVTDILWEGDWFKNSASETIASRNFFFYINPDNAARICRIQIRRAWREACKRNSPF